MRTPESDERKCGPEVADIPGRTCRVAGDLCRPVPTLPARASADDAEAVFAAETSAFCLMIADGDLVMGVLARAPFERFIEAFRRERGPGRWDALELAYNDALFAQVACPVAHIVDDLRAMEAEGRVLPEIIVVLDGTQLRGALNVSELLAHGGDGAGPIGPGVSGNDAAPVEVPGRRGVLRREPLGDMGGSLSRFRVIDVVGMLMREQSTGRLLLATAEPPYRTGMIYIAGGQVHHARFRELEGPEALSSLLALRDGLFQFHRDVTSPVQSIDAGTCAVLLSGAGASRRD